MSGQGQATIPWQYKGRHFLPLAYLDSRAGGYRWYLVLTKHGLDLDEHLCPRFKQKADARAYLDRKAG